MSRDSNDILKTSKELVGMLDEKDVEIKVFSETDPMLTLRNDILSFFRAIMIEVSDKQDLKKRIENSFLEDLESGDLPLDDRMRLYKLITSQTNISADSILSIFKPTPGAPSLLADNLSRDREEDHFDRVFENMKPSDLQKIDKLVKAIALLSDEEKK